MGDLKLSNSQVSSVKKVYLTISAEMIKANKKLLKALKARRGFTVLNAAVSLKMIPEIFKIINNQPSITKTYGYQKQEEYFDYSICYPFMATLEGEQITCSQKRINLQATQSRTPSQRFQATDVECAESTYKQNFMS